MAIYRVSLACMRLSDDPFANFCATVATKLTGNPNYTDPVITPTALAAACALFAARIQAARLGGPIDVTLKNDQRAVVEGMIRQLAAYVQSIAGDDLAKLQSSGFDATSSNRTRVQLPKPVIRRIEMLTSGTMAATVSAIRNARSWEVRVHNGTEEWHTFGGLTSSRKLVIPNRVPGQTYTIQVRAIGGLTGYSDWSDPVSHMAT